MANNRNAAIGFIFITILIDVIGFGIIIPVMPGLIAHLKQVDISTAAKYGSYLPLPMPLHNLFLRPYWVTSVINMAAGRYCYFHYWVLVLTIFFLHLPLRITGCSLAAL